MTEKTHDACEREAPRSEASQGVEVDQGDWLCDKTAEYQMQGFSVTKAKELAMQDWHTYMDKVGGRRA